MAGQTYEVDDFERALTLLLVLPVLVGAGVVMFLVPGSTRDRAFVLFLVVVGVASLVHLWLWMPHTVILEPTLR